MKIHIFALAALGDGISGGDRIFIEMARRWSKNNEVNVYVWEEGLAMCRRQKLEGKKLRFHLIKVGRWKSLGFVFTYFYRVFLGILLGFRVSIKGEENILYSASEFWMDSLPALILKYRYPRTLWCASWYQSAPGPLQGFSEGRSGGRYLLSGFLYWFVQKMIKPAVSGFSDVVIVNNESERRQFPKHAKNGRVLVMYGAVDLDRINDYQKRHRVKGGTRYEAVFQGRFHPQKGVVELVEIWKFVCKRHPKARLAMIGDGPLMDDVKEKIMQLKLSRNIFLLGYIYDGPEKYNVFSGSKVVVHPAYYDSGGMASAEAMAFGKPCVGFNLVSYKSYYPKGMVKVPIGDKKKFANAIVKLLEDKHFYRAYAKESKDMISENWSWNRRASDILKELKLHHGRLSSSL